MRLFRLTPALLWAAILFTANAGHAQALSGIDRSAIDAGVRPQDDFYTHANGAWLKRAVFPADKAYIGPLERLNDLTQDQLRALVTAAQGHTDDPEAKKLGDLYASFMNEAAIERLGVTPLATELAAIDAVTDRAQLAALFAHLGQIGVDTPLGLAIAQDDRDATRYVPALVQSGLELPTRDYYLKQHDAKFRDVRAKYVQYLDRLFTLAGCPRDAGAAARAVLALETGIARAQWSPVELRDPIKAYNPVAPGELPALAHAFDWARFLGGTGLAGKAPRLIVRQPSYVRGLGALFESAPLVTWKAYSRARLLDAYAPYLSAAFVDARRGFVGGVLAGTTKNRPRWKRGVQLVSESLGESLGKLYVAQHFPPASKQRMEAMVQNLLAAYRESLDSLDWMAPDTRRQALAKLATFRVKVGYPTRWIDYGTLVISHDDLVGNVMRARRFEDARQLAKLGQPVDREEWQLTPQTINAYYEASLNEIVFPAAYLQPPNFTPEADDAANYGAVGATIGHEISHGFDDEGSLYDGAGNLRDWWTAQDKASFKTRTATLVKQYDAFIAVPPNYHVNGALTLGENIADNAGLAIAWKAWQRSLGGQPSPVIDGLTGAQRFFYGFAQASSGKARPAALLAQIQSDPHAPDEFRVLGSLRNLGAFHATFGVKPGDRMFLAPAARVSIW
ncbi:MAG: M13 family metallopeptidase [Burkholderiales bacterium]